MSEIKISTTLYLANGMKCSQEKHRSTEKE